LVFLDPRFTSHVKLIAVSGVPFVKCCANIPYYLSTSLPSHGQRSNDAFSRWEQQNKNEVYESNDYKLEILLLPNNQGAYHL
jgi:16S rRNA A1518/A1519 N6-dimethyltransferase RsmA/KsgA/DIM1 with predicted DNA glycosylase/AP lyase activity